VYCGFCVEACPEDAIHMDTKILEIAAYSRERMVLDMNELLNLHLGVRGGPEHTSCPRIEGIRGNPEYTRLAKS
ncbi:MAG: 4Fe-4S binding protein, partial [Candidatus Omnitrophota bacterium]